MQVGYGVIRHQHIEYAGICFRNPVTYITYLVVHLKESSILTPPTLTDFIRRNGTIVEGELIYTINSMLFQKFNHLSGKDGTYDMAFAHTAFPPHFRAKVKGAASALMSVLTNSFEKRLCFFSQAMRIPASNNHLINIK